jgi:hypothetical protein
MAMFESGFSAPRKPVEEKPAEKEGLFSVFNDALRSHKHANDVSRRMIEAGKEAEEQRLREQRRKFSIMAG